MRRPNIAVELRRLEDQLRVVESLLEEGEERIGRRAPRVSAWSVAEQLDHLGKVFVRSLEHLLVGDRPLARGMTWKGRLILSVGRIPRGVARAPEAVRGVERTSGELKATLLHGRELLARVAAARRILERTEPLFSHPYFGGLTPAQALRALAIHTDHHLRIVADIRRATGS